MQNLAEFRLRILLKCHPFHWLARNTQTITNPSDCQGFFDFICLKNQCVKYLISRLVLSKRGRINMKTLQQLSFNSVLRLALAHGVLIWTH